MNNIMKKLLTTLFALAIIGAVYSQGDYVQWDKSSTGTLDPSETLTHTLPQILGEYDISIQIDPRDDDAGSDSTITYIVYQSNSLVDAVWTALGTASTISTGALDTDALYAISDFKGLRLKIIYTSTTADTCTVTTYWVYKKHANE